MQLNHESVPFRNQEFPIILVCDTILFQPNIGSLFRISEAFGVEKILFLGIGNQMNPRKINKTSRSTHLHVAHELFETKEALSDYLTSNDFEITSLKFKSSSSSFSSTALNLASAV